MIERTRVSTRKRMIALGILAAFTAIALSYLGSVLYEVAGKSINDFYKKLADLTLQLAVIVIIGALLKAFVDWEDNQRKRQLKALEACLEFMRRVRSVSVSVANARDLLNAHRSQKTWSEQSRRLMELRPEVVEISEDLKVSSDLFVGKDIIIEGLEEIVSYLQAGREEYVKNHDHVESGYKNGRTLDETIQDHEMSWIADMMDAGPSYNEKYIAGLRKAKFTMRREIYGG